ncbi:MAG: SEC-C domain-containing protein [Myxococcales bacterium]|nr:SEC-C domain-containing protein [Myxococcales bacterium]
MALIPYAHLPPPLDPPLLVAEQPLEEYYCGDARCDCATAHVLFVGVPMTIDLGTCRVDYLNEQEQSSQAREVLRQTLRAQLEQGAIKPLREHYQKVREYGRDWHFRYMDWTRLQPGEVVAWDQVFRHLGTPVYTLTKKGTADEHGEADSAGDEVRLGLADAYCVLPRCDCQRVVWTVVTAPKDGTALRSLGTVEYSLATGQHAVLSTAPGMDPNHLFLLVNNLLQVRPDFISEAQQRYAFLREQLTPIVQLQRSQRMQARHNPATVGRNDACPCGSGKKFKRCHGS